MEQIGDSPLINEARRRDDDKHDSFADEDDEFDDQFEEDLLDKKLMNEFHLQQQSVEDNVKKSDSIDLSTSRWVAYDALSSMLER